MAAVLAVSAIVLASAAITAAGRDPWVVAQARLDYQLYRPYQTFGLRPSVIGYPTCIGGRRKDSFYTEYGPKPTSKQYKTKPSFELGEGKPHYCANGPTNTPHGTVLINGRRAHLSVACGPPTLFSPSGCSLSQGVRNGYQLWWKMTRGGTQIAILSWHMTLSHVLSVARSLRPVRTSK